LTLLYTIKAKSIVKKIGTVSACMETCLKEDGHFGAALEQRLPDRDAYSRYLGFRFTKLILIGEYRPS
jgi:hypothetical protein